MSSWDRRSRHHKMWRFRIQTYARPRIIQSSALLNERGFLTERLLLGKVLSVKTLILRMRRTIWCSSSVNHPFLRMGWDRMQWDKVLRTAVSVRNFIIFASSNECIAYHIRIDFARTGSAWSISAGVAYNSAAVAGCGAVPAWKPQAVWLAHEPSKARSIYHQFHQA